MTSVVYATYSEGYAYVYFRDDKGALTQTAQVLVSSSEPAELTAIIAELADNLDWAKVVHSRNGHTPVQPAAPPAVKPTPRPVRADTKAALTKKRRAPHSPDRLKRSKEEIRSFDASVLALLRESGPLSVPQITERLLHTRDQKAQGNVRSSLQRLWSTRALARDTSAHIGGAHRYSVAVVGPLEPDRVMESSAPDEASSPASAEAAEV